MLVRTGDLGGALDWASCDRASSGRAASGAGSILRRSSRGIVVSVADALGEGPAADFLVEKALDCLFDLDPETSLPAMVGACHAALQGTSGVELMLLRVDRERETIAWCGVGRLRAFLHRALPRRPARFQRLATMDGLVGLLLPEVKVGVSAVQRGDQIAVVTGAVSPGFPAALLDPVSPREGALRIVAHYARTPYPAHAWVGHVG